MGRVFGRVAAASVVAAVGPSTASALPRGTVGGIQSPASLGALELTVLATESEGVGLRSATALIDRQVKATTRFEAGACRADRLRRSRAPRWSCSTS
jgi:hypothetical protein